MTHAKQVHGAACQPRAQSATDPCMLACLAADIATFQLRICKPPGAFPKWSHFLGFIGLPCLTI